MKEITLKDVRQEAFSAIKAIKEGKIKLEDAKVINNLLGAITETAKTEVAFLNALPKNIKDSISFEQAKQIGGGLRDTDREIEESLVEIAERNLQPYQ